ncbi:MAG: hypothetical protein AMJ89_06375 [candidate division Zixibacteria bacterium SM23_73]|nr:MAG: hypothetical protein AMJ89_06375 [candidate division Zixibacteria bacterium SM23_73]
MAPIKKSPAKGMGGDFQGSLLMVHFALWSCTSSPARGGMSKEDLGVEGKGLSTVSRIAISKGPFS